MPRMAQSVAPLRNPTSRLAARVNDAIAVTKVLMARKPAKTALPASSIQAVFRHPVGMLPRGNAAAARVVLRQRR